MSDTSINRPQPTHETSLPFEGSADGAVKSRPEVYPMPGVHLDQAARQINRGTVPLAFIGGEAIQPHLVAEHATARGAEIIRLRHLHASQSVGVRYAA